MTERTRRRAAVVGGARTPFAKAATVFRKRTALELAVHSVDGLLAKHDVDPRIVQMLVYGIVVVNARIPQMAREINLASRLPDHTRSYTVTDNCITGATAVASVVRAIRDGAVEVGMAGGVESMSNPSLLFNTRASRIFLNAAAARSLGARARQFLRLRPRDFLPQPPGIEEPSTGLSMGEHVELMVKEWKVPREAQDEIALRSHQRARAATADGRLPAEIYSLDRIAHDTLIRPDTSMEKLAQLPPVFDRSPSGTVTAGNSSPLTDGAAAVLLMSEAHARALGREPLAYVRDFEFSAIDPADGLLMAPALAVPRLLARNGLALADFDVVEMHEAFGGQVICNLAAWERGWKEPAVGSVDPERLNPLGSSIAVGHPFAATGIRMIVTLANELRRRNGRYGLISICGAGATAAAMILERD